MTTSFISVRKESNLLSSELCSFRRNQMLDHLASYTFKVPEGIEPSFVGSGPTVITTTLRDRTGKNPRGIEPLQLGLKVRYATTTSRIHMYIIHIMHMDRIELSLIGPHPTVLPLHHMCVFPFTRNRTRSA